MVEQVNFQVVQINSIHGVLVYGLVANPKILIHQKIGPSLLGIKQLKMYVLLLLHIILR